MDPITITAICGIAAAVVGGVFWARKHASSAAVQAATHVLNQVGIVRVPTPAQAVVPAVPAPVVPVAFPVKADVSIAPPPGGNLVVPARNPLSNAPAGYPDVVDGYPAWYALALGGVPVGSPRLIYDGNAFATAAEIEAYKGAIAQRAINLASYTVPAWTGSLAATSLNVNDWCYLIRNPLVPWHTIIGGDYDYIRGQINYAFYNALASFDLDSYQGVLKSV